MVFFAATKATTNDVNTISDDLDGGLPRPTERASGGAKTAAGKKRFKSSLRQNSRTASSLNLVVTNGDHVVATRHRTCAEVPPSLYLSVGHEYMNSGNMVIGGSHDFKGIGALLIASEPLSQQYAHQWMLLEPGEMVSASFINHHEVGSKPNDAAEDNDPEVATDIILMKVFVSSLPKAEGPHGRGVGKRLLAYHINCCLSHCSDPHLHRLVFVRSCQALHCTGNFVNTEKKQGALPDRRVRMVE